MNSAKLFLLFGSTSMAIGVVLGAFAAHGLKSRLSADMLAVFRTGVEYQLIHSLGLVLTGLAIVYLQSSPQLRWSGWSMLSGILLFSGSLYALSLTGIRSFGMITPIGGLFFITAWLLFAVGIWKVQ